MGLVKIALIRRWCFERRLVNRLSRQSLIAASRGLQLKTRAVQILNTRNSVWKDNKNQVTLSSLFKSLCICLIPIYHMNAQITGVLTQSESFWDLMGGFDSCGQPWDDGKWTGCRIKGNMNSSSLRNSRSLNRFPHINLERSFRQSVKYSLTIRQRLTSKSKINGSKCIPRAPRLWMSKSRLYSTSSCLKWTEAAIMRHYLSFLTGHRRRYLNAWLIEYAARASYGMAACSNQEHLSPYWKVIGRLQSFLLTWLLS
jgi:hypothetical protein